MTDRYANSRACTTLMVAWLLSGVAIPHQLCTCVSAQTIQQQQSFEDLPPGNELPFTTNFSRYADGPGDDVFGIVTNIRNIPAAQDGTKFFGAVDVQSPGTEEGEGILTFDGGNICNLVNPQFAWYYNVQGLDDGDDLFYQLVLDGFPEEPVKYVDGGNDFSTTGFEEMIVDVPNRAVIVALRLILRQNGSDQIGIDNVRVLATGTNGACTPVCGVSIDEGNLVTNCLARTDPVNTDALRASIEYAGGEVGVVVGVSGGAALATDSDDPSVIPDGVIRLEGLVEGGRYAMTIRGGDCVLAREVEVPIDVPSDFCTSSELVINEVLADPGSLNDANGDGFFEGANDEFVELYNGGDVPLDVSGFTVEEGTGQFHRFPAGTVIPALEFYTIFGGGDLLHPACDEAAVANRRNFIGLNNSGDVVLVRDTRGREVASMSYGAEGNEDRALALNPDGNLAGGYVPHPTILLNPVRNSACGSNSGNILPIGVADLAAKTVSGGVVVTWSVPGGRSTGEYLVDRSANGRYWRSVASMETHRDIKYDYSVLDEHPPQGLHLYRLRWVGRDGLRTQYGPVSALVSGAGDLAVRPNPATGSLMLSRVVRTGDVVTIVSTAGRILRTLPAGSRAVDVRDLPAGIYFLGYQRGGVFESTRFVKQ